MQTCPRPLLERRKSESDAETAALAPAVTVRCGAIMLSLLSQTFSAGRSKKHGSVRPGTTR
jgi:hypothetical protein